MQVGERTAVIVVDMQNDFCSADGASARLGSDVSRNQEVAARLPAFLDAVRARGALVVWIRQSMREEYASPARRARAKAMGRRVTDFAKAGTWGAELYDGLVPDAADITVDKAKYSAFIGTNLDTILRAQQRTDLVICGTAANVCVDSTVRDAFQADYRVAVPRDLVGYTREDLSDAALQTLGFYFCDVVESGDLLR